VPTRYFALLHVRVRWRTLALLVALVAVTPSIHAKDKKSKILPPTPKDAAVMAVVAAAGAWAGVPPAESRQLTICMESISGNVVIMYEARTVVSGIFAAIGMKIQWFDPLKCPTEAIYVSFSRDAPTCKHATALAYAMPYEGRHIVVFLERIKDRAPSASGRLLGYTVAHEVTHILEGVVLHSETGIMKAHWGTDDLYQMRLGRFGFGAEDVYLIYCGLKQREWRLAASASGAPME
jgi:hypothetical protein